MDAPLLRLPVLSTIPRDGWTARATGTRDHAVDLTLADALGHAFLRSAALMDAGRSRVLVPPESLIDDHFRPLAEQLAVLRGLEINVDLYRSYALGFAEGMLGGLHRKLTTVPVNVPARALVCKALRIMPAYVIDACQVADARDLPESWTSAVQAAEHGAYDLLSDPPVFVPVLRLVGEERTGADLQLHLVLAQSATSNNASGTWLELLAHRPAATVASLISRFPLIRRLNNFRVGNYDVEVLARASTARSTTTGDLMRVERVDHADNLSVVSYVLVGPTNWVPVPPELAFAYEAAIIRDEPGSSSDQVDALSP